MGVNGVLNAVLKPRTSGESEINKSLEKIYEDKSIFINQLYLDDYGTVWNKYVQEGVFVNEDILKSSLYKMIFLKDLVSEFVWFLLTGTLVTSVAYNYIVNSGCSKSVKDIHKHHNEIKKQKISNLTPEQRYFLAYGYAWMVNIKDEALASQIMTDVHAPAQFRINGPLSNSLDFYKAFNIKKTDKMFRPEALRVVIW